MFQQMGGHRLWPAAAPLVPIATALVTVDVSLHSLPKGFTVVVCVILAVGATADGLVHRSLVRTNRRRWPWAPDAD
jgi:hypothetical protein